MEAPSHQTKEHRSLPDDESEPLDTWIGDELLGVLNRHLDKSRDNASTRTASPGDIAGGNPGDSSDSGYCSMVSEQAWSPPATLSPPTPSRIDSASSIDDSDTSAEGTQLLIPPQMDTSPVETASSIEDSDTSDDEDLSLISAPMDDSETRTPPISPREPTYVAIASSAEDGTLFKDTQRWMDDIEKQYPLPTTQQPSLVKTESSI
jgi:hypothetical protein